jgi:hypothetical protein
MEVCVDLGDAAHAGMARSVAVRDQRDRPPLSSDGLPRPAEQ